MNHLAHFHLAGDDDALVVGALLGDYLKGPLEGRVSAPLELGVRLHRRVDAYMDGHPLLLELRRGFPGRERRLAGVVLDMYFDHFLATHWSRFHERGLPDFCGATYLTLQRNHALLPPQGVSHSLRMAEHDLLARYGDPVLIEEILARIGARLGMAALMQSAIAHANRRLAEWEPVFLAYYPRAIEMARAFALSAAR